MILNNKKIFILLVTTFGSIVATHHLPAHDSMHQQKAMPTMHEEDQKTAPSHEHHEHFTSSFTKAITAQLQTSNSLWLTILLVFLLGLLLSFTPCLYSMIPLTMGMLHAHSSSSFKKNFLLALSYTVGIATTFALLGLIAALTGQFFGSLFHHPLIILCIALFLGYLGLSMLGVVELYLPHSLMSRAQATPQGSLLSAFIFGAISGTVSSPCLSPGLLLLLTIVTALKSKLLGFILLFIFGIGLSMPLLLIGTFSGSILLLPQTGHWTVEIKRLFSFFLFGMSFYFLNTVFSERTVLGVISITLLCIALFYIHFSTKAPSLRWKIVNRSIALLVLLVALYCAYLVYTITPHNHAANHMKITWNSDYETALQLCKKENKKLFIEVGASFCSLCKAIDAKLFDNEHVQTELTNFITLKIDGGQQNTTSCCIVKDRFNVMGFPTVLVINPENETIMRQWGGELYEETHEQFITQLAQLK